MAKLQKLNPPRPRGESDPLGLGGRTAAEARRVTGARVENPYGNGIDGVVVVADTVALLAGRGKLTPVQQAAAKRYRVAAERAGSLGDCVLAKDGGAAGLRSGVSEARLAAAADLNDAFKALGPLHWVIHAVCVDGWTLSEVAGRVGGMPGAEIGRDERAGAGALLRAGLDTLVQKWFPPTGGNMHSVRADDARGQFFSDGQTSSISAGVSVHCTVHRVFFHGEAR